MTDERFQMIMEEQINYCKELLTSKNKEYKGETDRLHTFKAAAVVEGCSMKQALAGMMVKHTISVYDMCREGEYSADKWTEKITDSINYLLLLKAMVMEDEQ